MHTSNIHEITKKAAVSIAVKIITGHLLRTMWYRICNIETEKIPHQLLNLPCRWGLEGAFRAMKGATCSHHGFTNANPMPIKKAKPVTPHFLSLNQDIVARPQEAKCELK